VNSACSENNAKYSMYVFRIMVYYPAPHIA